MTDSQILENLDLPEHTPNWYDEISFRFSYDQVSQKNKRIAEFLSIPISGYKDIRKQSECNNSTLMSFIDTVKQEKFKDLIQKIRDCDNEEKQKSLKMALPAASMADFEGSRAQKNVRHIYGLPVDIDVKDNPSLSGPEAIVDAKLLLLQEKSVICAMASPRYGVKAFVVFDQPQTDIDRVRIYSRIISERITALTGFVVDNMSDCIKLIYVSSDRDVFFNYDFQPFDCTAEYISFLQSKADKEPPSYDDYSYNRIPDGANNDYDMCRSIMSYLSTIKILYSDWIKVAMGIKSTFGESGKPLFDMFLGNPNYHDTAVRLNKLWNWIPLPNKVGIGSVIFYATQYGWNDLRFSDSRQNLERVDLSIYDKQIAMSNSDDYQMDYVRPEHEFHEADESDLIRMYCGESDASMKLDHLPDMIKEYIGICSEITDARPEALISAFISVFAANIGNRMVISNAGSDHFCNIWTIIIGKSTISRKTTSINLATSMLHDFHESLFELPAKDRIEKDIMVTKVTQARLLNLLSIDPNRIIVQNEMASWMQDMNKSYNAGMKQELTNMFDGADMCIGKMDVNEFIRKPAFSILGATTPDWFFDELKSLADQKGGFLQRCLICIVLNIDVDALDLSVRDNPIKRRELFKFGQYLEVCRAIPPMTRLNCDLEAKEYRDSKYDKILREACKKEMDLIASYCSRIYDNYWFRFCILIYCMKYIDEIRTALELNCFYDFINNHPVNLEIASQAMNLCEYYFDNVFPFLESMSESQSVSLERKLVGILAKHPNGEMRHSQLLNKSRLSAKDFKPVIESLLEKHAISTVGWYSTNYKNAVLYQLNPCILKKLT